MNKIKAIGKSILRIFVLLLSASICLSIIYWLLPAGKDFNDSEHDKMENGIWLSHGFLGDDLWFKLNQRDINLFRNREKLEELFAKLQKNHFKFIYPHLCPAKPNGHIANYSTEQVELLLDVADDYQLEVLPWVGGVLNESAIIHNPKWRAGFVESIRGMLKEHPRLAGVQINIEPLPSGDRDFLLLLDEVKQAIGDKMLSIAAYPPPTFWQPSENIHWELEYLEEVAKRSDQLAVMMYDTSIRLDKFYIRLMRRWSNELNQITENTSCKLLLGVPVYEDYGVGYHYPNVENLENGLSGIAGGNIGHNYQGVAVYCEWTMDDEEWLIWRRFIRE